MRFVPSRETIRAWTKHLILGACIFTVGLLWHFPYERIGAHLTSSLTRQTGFEFDMDKLSPALPIGFVAENARLIGPREMPIKLNFNLLRTTVSPFSLLAYPFRKALTISYKAEQDEGTLSGYVRSGRENSGFEVKTDSYKIQKNFSLAAINPLLGSEQAKLAGDFGVSTEFEGPTAAIMAQDLTTSTGQIAAALNQVVLEAPFVKRLRFDRISVDAELKDGKIDLKAIQLSGPDVTGVASGSIKVEPFFLRSQVQIEAKLTVSPNAKELRDMLNLYVLPTVGAQNGIKMDEQGTIAFRVSGPITPVYRLSIRGY